MGKANDRPSPQHELDERERAEIKSRRRGEELEALREIALAVTSQLELAELLNDVVKLGCRLLNVSAGSIYLLDEKRGDLELVVNYGFATDYIGQRLAPGEGLSGKVLQSGQPMVVQDYSHWEGRSPKWEAEPLTGILGMPLECRGRTIGVLLFEELSRVRSFDEHDIWLAGLFASQVAIAIENAQLFAEAQRELAERQRAEQALQEATQELERRNARLEALYRIGQVLNWKLDKGTILDHLTDEAMRVTRASHGQVLVVDKERGCFVRESLRGFSEEETERARTIPLPLDRGINGRVYKTHQAVCVDDVRAEPSYFPLIPATRTELAVPIIRQEEVLGNLDLQSPEVGAFRDVDLDYLNALADQVAVALANAHLLEEAQQEIAERQRAEEALREINATLEAQVAARTAEIRAEKEKSEAILLNVGDAILMTDGEMRIQYANPAFTTLTGYALPEVLNAPAGPIIAETGSEPQRQSLAVALTTGQSWRGELVGRRKDRRTFDAMVTIVPVRDERGQLAGYVISLQDISQRKELERARSQFLTNISHQLRTPIASLKLSAHLLGKDRPPEESRRLFQIVEQQTARLAHLIQDILEMATLDSGLGVTTWQPVSIPHLIENSMVLYQDLARSSGITLITLPHPPDLPVVKGDEVRLSQALAEIVENAVTFTPAGGQVVVGAETVAEGTLLWVAIAVRDTGPGIPADEQGRIFERFFRGRLAEPGHIPGTGLGLSIAQEIMRLHGGRVTVESEPGQGSTFTLWLPAEAKASRLGDDTPRETWEALPQNNKEEAS